MIRRTPQSPDPHAPVLRRAEFRFYEELNDFLPPARRKRGFDYPFAGTPAVKDAIEALGVPHTEVDLILIDGEPAGFQHRIEGGERVAVYPTFERLDISPINRLRPRPLRNPRFVLDVHLGRLAGYLRLLGFDTLYRNDYEDATIVEIAAREGRIVLTRDVGLLKHGAVTRGHWLRETAPRRQLAEVTRTFDLRGLFRPFTRCMRCNARLLAADKDAVRDRIPAGVYRDFDAFLACPGCRRVYWRGSHYDRLARLVEAL